MRVEFTRKTKATIHLRANGCCELCHAKLKVGEGEVDHIVCAELGGEATVDNGRLLCKPCHREKTTSDIRRLRKAERVRDKHSGAMKPAANPMPGSKKSRFKKHMDGSVSYR